MQIFSFEKQKQKSSFFDVWTRLKKHSGRGFNAWKWMEIYGTGGALKLSCDCVLVYSNKIHEVLFRDAMQRWQNWLIEFYRNFPFEDVRNENFKDSIDSIGSLSNLLTR